VEGEFQETLDRAKRGESTRKFETQWLRKDGTVGDISLTASPIRNVTGGVVGVSAIARDITEWKRIEEQLRLQAAALAAAANSIVITDLGGQVRWVNPAFTTLTGYELGEVMGKNPRVLKSGQHDRDFYEQMWKTVTEGRVWQGEVVNRRKDGSFYREEMTITPVLSDDGAIQNFVAIKQDISARKSLEEQLRQSLKMEAVGQLAGGVAHDFNNFLQVVIIHCELLADELGPDSHLNKMVKEIRHASKHAARLVSQLLAFSRKQVLQPKILNLNSVVSEADTMLRRLIREDIKLSTVTAADLGQVKVDPTQIMQALINLATNARDAMPYGGLVKIETQNVTFLEKEIHPTMSVPAGRYVLLQVTDNGTGMDEKTKARIFEPFFTTKDASGVGTRTGLGLASVHGIVRQSAGYILVDSQIGRGTTLKIYLPRVDEEYAEPEQAKEDSVHLRVGSATVLVAEDSELIRIMMPKILKTLNCQVLLAADGIEALQIAERHRGPIHLLITDVVMPGLRGPELAAQLATSRPEMKVLYMSGYSNEILAERTASGATWEFIQKPVEPQDLRRKVNELLESVTYTTAPTVENAQQPRSMTVLGSERHNG
jgi:PAS domain S-box-containing protein